MLFWFQFAYFKWERKGKRKGTLCAGGLLRCLQWQKWTSEARNRELSIALCVSSKDQRTT